MIASPDARVLAIEYGIGENGHGRAGNRAFSVTLSQDSQRRGRWKYDDVVLLDKRAIVVDSVRGDRQGSERKVMESAVGNDDEAPGTEPR